MKWKILGLMLMATGFVAGEAAAEEFHFVTLSFPPLEFEEPDKKVTGAAVEVVREVMKSISHSVTIELLPWPRALSAVKDGNADAIFTAYRTPEREKFLEYSHEVLVPQVVSLYIKKGSGRTFTGDFQELAPYVIGILSTISYGRGFDAAREKYKLKTDRVDNLELNFKKLVAGRLDYVISNRYSAQYVINALGIEKDVQELTVPVEVTPSFVGFAKTPRATKLIEAFDAGLRELKRNGRYDAIMERFDVRVPKSS